MFCNHVILLGIALLESWFLLAEFIGWKRLFFTHVCMMFPVMGLIVLINTMFQHYGVTVLYILDSGNAITLEAILYGVVMAEMLLTVLSWFSIFHQVVQSDQILYLVGKFFPGLALALSMSLRFVPQFTIELKQIQKSGRQLGLEPEKGHPIKKIKWGIRNLSILISQALENSIHTVKSMRGRGFGQSHRTSYTNYRFGRKEWLQLFFLTIGIAISAYGFITRKCYASYNPKIILYGNAWVYLAFACFGLFPCMVSHYENLQKMRRKNKVKRTGKEKTWKLWKY